MRYEGALDEQRYDALRVDFSAAFWSSGSNTLDIIFLLRRLRHLDDDQCALDRPHDLIGCRDGGVAGILQHA